ncbi:MAG: hypothetical protein E7658_02410 [Ruminococcaceae bacterium]|nr:hypothetical protein [Oscillospiraceae bacterium]
MCPENTMVSFRYALALRLYGVETDIRMTADGELVLMHDHMVDRTTNGHENLCVFTLAELKAPDAGSWFPKEYAGEKIPTFAEFPELAKDKDVFLNIKIKDARDIVTEKTIRMLESCQIGKERFLIAPVYPTATN